MARNDSNVAIVYLFVNRHDHYVVSYGISFQDFVRNLRMPLNHLLLLKHRFEESEYHLYTQLDYVSKEQMGKLLKKDIRQFGDFCWIDFEDVFSLDEVEAQELAELLYLGHMKRHLTPPFYQKLNNRFAYLTSNDGWSNKIYYRNWIDFYDVLGGVIANKLSDVKLDVLFGGFRKRKVYPGVEKAVLQQLNSLFTEGLVLSFQSASQVRNQVSIPFWVVGDYFDMEEMLESYRSLSKKSPAGSLLYDKKSKAWSVTFSDK